MHQLGVLAANMEFGTLRAAHDGGPADKHLCVFGAYVFASLVLRLASIILVIDPPAESQRQITYIG